MGCIAAKKQMEKQVHQLDIQVQKLQVQNQDLINEINILSMREQQIAQLTEAHTQRKKIDLTALSEELYDKFKELEGICVYLSELQRKQENQKIKEIGDWNILFDRLDQSKGQLSYIQEEEQEQQ